MQLVNVTPHAITILTDGADPVVLPVSGMIARCATTTQDRGTVAGMPVTATTFGEVVDLPAPQDGVAYVASLLVVQAAWSVGRRDVYSPGVLVRDAAGLPVGCRGLSVPA